MSCLFDNTKARWLHVLLPTLFVLACLLGVRPAQAADYGGSISVAYQQNVPQGAYSGLTDIITFSYFGTWDASPGAKLNWELREVAVYNGNFGYYYGNQRETSFYITGGQVLTSPVTANSNYNGMINAMSNRPSGTTSGLYHYELSVWIVDSNGYPITQPNVYKSGDCALLN